jgi:hypothetical protein
VALSVIVVDAAGAITSGGDALMLPVMAQDTEPVKVTAVLCATAALATEPDATTMPSGSARSESARASFRIMDRSPFCVHPPPVRQHEGVTL